MSLGLLFLLGIIYLALEIIFTFTIPVVISIVISIIALRFAWIIPRIISDNQIYTDLMTNVKKIKNIFIANIKKKKLKLTIEKNVNFFS